MTARDLCAIPDPPTTDELLGTLVIRGQRVAIGAHTGEGKTTLVTQMTRAFTEGKDFLGFKGAGGRALILDAEQGLRTVKRRLREAGLDNSTKVDYARAPDGLELDHNEQHILRVEEILRRGHYDLVVLDPLYKLQSGDSNSEREAVDLMCRFDAWRERFDFALVLPVHCRKPTFGTRFNMHDFFGSTAYLRGAEVVLGLQRTSDGYSRLHFFKDRDGDLQVGQRWGLLYDHEHGFRRDPSDGETKETTVDKVHDLLTSSPGKTIEEIIEATGAAERTVRRRLSRPPWNFG